MREVKLQRENENLELAERREVGWSCGPVAQPVTSSHSRLTTGCRRSFGMAGSLLSKTEGHIASRPYRSVVHPDGAVAVQPEGSELKLSRALFLLLNRGHGANQKRKSSEAS
jgi:hypothetical protein